MNVSPGADYTAVFQAPTGLAGTLALGLLDADGVFVEELSDDDVLEVAATGIYIAARVAPLIAGRYSLVWSLDGTETPGQLQVDELLVTSSRVLSGLPGGRDLCELGDVLRYAPGYDSDPDTDDTLQALITAESRELHKLREFRPIPDLPVRRFLITVTAARLRTVRIGDCALVDGLELQNELGDTTATVDPSTVLFLPLVRQEWQPIEEIKLPTGATAGRYLEVTGVWGFPSVPEDIREACVKRVILRYLTDVAARGTAFADALNDGTINIGGLFASAQETLDFYTSLPVE